MNVLGSEINPFEPPPDPARTLRSLEPTVPLGLGGVKAACTKRGWISRTIQLTGAIEAEIRYQGAGWGERVYVDNVLAARTPLFVQQASVVTPQIDFTIMANGQSIPARIQVTASWTRLLRISTFSLTVFESVVHAE